VAYGTTLTLWVTAQYLRQNAADQQALLLLAGLLGVGALVLAATFFWPVVTGIGAELLIAVPAAGADAAVTGAALTESAGGLAATVNTSFNMMTAIGRPGVELAF
jgi:glucose-6-phosphate-specific signal transduction histidine kinase